MAAGADLGFKQILRNAGVFYSYANYLNEISSLFRSVTFVSVDMLWSLVMVNRPYRLLIPVLS